ncbi:MAG: hypothetical protein ASARMPRED_004768 [Alectoria sarmentosa]|nr:MAG: hypothetical protein ASARMPRED_004768 [Alectoria sarmentosa]
MTTLLDLPNEIKLEIIETIAPDDIENFSLCCKSVYDLAGRTLRQHMVDKTTYRRCFSLSTWNEGHTMCLVAYCKLRDMSESRRLRLYPRSIRIGNYTVSDQDRETNRLRHPEYVWSRSTQVMDKVRGISDSIFNNLDSPCVDMDEMKAWRKKIGDGEVGAANCLLLTLLPNVERIDVDELDRSHSEMSDMIYKISKTNEDVSSMIWEKLSLVKLQEVHVHSLACLGGATTQSRVLEACMTLPSLRIVRGTQLGRRYKFNEWIYPDRCSNVTELHFRGCTLAVKHLACLFKHLKALQIFSYDHSRLPETPGKEYGPDELIDALRLYAKTTLTFFNYTSDARDHTGDHRMPNASILRRFEALKTLRMSRVMLIVKGAPRKLVDELPSSLEELELVDPISATEARQMFEGILATKQERLPKLRLVVFEGAIPFDNEVIAAYERIGLVLDWRDTGTNRIQKTDQAWLGGVECLRS